VIGVGGQSGAKMGRNVRRVLDIVRQNTLKSSIGCTGVGLHSGVDLTMTLRPAPPSTGIVFVRADLDGAQVPARYDLVCETMYGTTLANEDGVTVTTVEHLLAALWGCGVDNVFVELDGAEVPVMDGSAAPFVFLVECAGLREQAAPRNVIRVLQTVSVEGDGKRMTIEPSDRFSVDFLIDFDNPVVGRQQFSFAHANGAFKSELSRARTFGFIDEIEMLHAAGLARGGSLDNAVVVGKDRVLNDDGLRYGDEFVRHKVLDCIGDLYLAGAPLLGHVTAAYSGHQLNNALLRALFADESNWNLETLRAGDMDWPAASVAALG